MKYCKDCKHYRDRWFRKALCGHPELVHPDTAKPYQSCEGLRMRVAGYVVNCGMHEQAEPGVVRKSWVAVIRWIARLVGVPL